MSAKTFAFNPATDIPSLEGKVILITGANTGLGKRTALELAGHNPAHIWMTSRDVKKGEAAVAEVRALAPPNTAVSLMELDLSSLTSVKKAAEGFLALATRLDILFLNAGILGHPASLTKDGYEIHMGTNHLGHAALLRMLTPLLLRTAASSSPNATDVRVISLTSIGYRTGNDPNGISLPLLKQPHGLPQIQRYCQSKLANLLYAQQVARRNDGKFKIVAVHPGEVATELFSREHGDEQVRYLATEVAPTRYGSVEDGVKNQLWAATAPADGVQNGGYYEPVGVGDALQSWGKDEILAGKLWAWTETELGVHGL